ncbi:PREDICTED: receptor-type tyrosine-protein phosphatase F-like [Amphimedon queenslandica]|uniref:protein-tyrosine-phosphatase n=1 Tax=Amphimedon queenslandica TaxID=400682 RepID=A0A1X7VP06_AMPQE|nr:PREDICTED: receptor-type tyrosine-protein phosphatase F-like [Amphimedon queenslandica]|eukprot:XP_019860969.1 PREDICTED: receptor-type tyrosine-protein phosphatase F-like [Amphimedon queenslandica]
MSLRITWTELLEDDQNGVIIGYNISYFSLPAVGQPINNFTSDTSYNISGLDVYTDYNVSVAAYTSAGTGPFDSVIRRTDSTVPTSPSDVSYINISSTSIEVSWNPPTDFNGPNEGYVITYIRLESDTESMSTNRLTGTSFVIENLEKYEQYSVTVVAFTDKGPGASSDVLSVLTDEDLPGPPSNVSTMSTNTSISITWSPPLDPNGLLLSYSINVTLNSTYAQYLSFDVMTMSVSQNIFSYTLFDLLPFAGYDISLQASTSVGLGTPAIETETTLQAAPAAPVANPMASPVSSTAVNVSWLPPNLSNWNGLITNYTIEYRTNDEYIRPSIEVTATLSSFANSDDPRAATTPLQLESIIIPSLHEFVNYSFIITLSNSIGQISSLPVHIVTLESTPSGPPLDVSVIVDSPSTARISWSPPMYIDRNGIIVNYTVRIITTVRGTIRETNISNVSGNYYDASDLPQFASFNVTVAAATSVGLGPYSPSVSNMTFEGVPSAPDPVIVKRRNDTAIQVNWTRPAEPNGIILGYLIYYIGTKNNTGTEYSNINVLIIINVTDPNTLSYLITNLLADTQYFINVTAYTSAGLGAVGDGDSILLPTGRPPTVPPNVTIGTPPTGGTSDPTTATTIRIEVTIPEELNANGPLTRIRILIRIFLSRNDTISTWYESQKFPNSVAPPWQATQLPLNQGNRRKRQAGGETVAETIGTNNSCGPNDIVCNGPLKPGTQYQFKYRVYNSDDDDSYVESQYSGPIRTDPIAEENNTGTTIVIAVVVVLLVIILLIAILVIVVIIVLKRRKRKAYSFAASFNGKEELITAGEGKGATLSKAIQLTPTDPTIVPLTENTIVNPTAVRTASVKATPNSRKVYLRDFPSYVEDMLNDAGFKFSEEYEKVSAVGLDHSKDASLLPENRAKNRYTNILAYDHSRVKLESIDDEPGSDYINANYIPGYRMRRAYIATQGPLPSTFDDFWRMTWEQNSHVIVMLTQLVERGRTKCHRYWPGAQPEVYGEINVDMLSETEKSDWIVRKFKITKEKRSRTITHYQFVSWPDHGVPDEAGPALDFVREVHEVASSAFGPVIVHCSAGVGRTGTFIALGTLLQHIKDHDWVDLFGLASEMRQHRNHMIQTEPQYVFIHKAMVDACKSSMSKFGGGIKVLPSFPIYSNIGPASQLSDFYGDMLSEEASYQYQKTSGNGKTYDESTF